MSSNETGQPEVVAQTDAQGALSDHITQMYKTASRTRYAEEREWATAGYFDQNKQWLEEDPAAGGRLRPMDRKKDAKWPQPVTNLFSKTINTNANALGADIPRMLALSDNYDARNRRAAEAAEKVIDTGNRESTMEIINPTLAKRVVLWGWGCTYDTIAFDHSTVDVPEVAPPPTQPPALPASTDQPMPQAGQQPQEQAAPDQQASPELQAMGVETVPTARLQTYLLTPFEVYLPRDSADINLCPWQIVRWRRRLGLVKELYPAYAQKFTADTADVTLAFYYLNTLRSLSFQNSAQNEAEEEFCTLTEFWCEWQSVPEEVQKKIAAEWQSEPSEIYSAQGFTKLEAAIEYGLFAVQWKGQLVQWAENPWDGDSPLTFFPFQKDSVSVYPKGLSVELIPLTKSLNRVDSLMLRAVMSTGTGKWLVPTTQPIVQLSGDPVEKIEWDPIGDGKVKPEWINPTPYGSVLIQLRQQIVEDFKELGFSNSVAEGEMPGAGTAFRLAAYMGAKAEETRKTMRYLWEQAHEIRARKLVKMARKVWTEPRKVQAAGFNNQFAAQQLEAADIPEDGYSLNVIQDSSKPKTQTEKLQVLQLAQQGGYVNPQDPATREYVLDALGLQDLDPSDHLQYMKADRDLEKLKHGIQPMESPFEKWDIPLRVIAQYTLTEEFESSPENVRHGILMYAQYLSEKLSAAQGAPVEMPTPPQPPGAPPAGPGGAGGQPASHVLGQVPGAQVSTPQVEGAAIREAASVVPNSPSPSA